MIKQGSDFSSLLEGDLLVLGYVLKDENPQKQKTDTDVSPAQNIVDENSRRNVPRHGNN